MAKLKNMAVFWIPVLCLIFVPRAFSQAEQVDIDALKKQATKVFIDCEFCDIDFIRTEITFVNYVWDRKEAQVHVLITTQRTASGGVEYTLTFIGQREYEGVQDVLKFYSKKNDTEDDIRRGIVRVLKMGLMSYVAKTPLGEHVEISFKEKVKPTAAKDKWNFWVFSASIDGYFSGEQSRTTESIYGSFSANRTTPDWKISTSVSASYDESDITIGNEKSFSYSDSKYFSSLIVKSITDHWSIGGYLSASSDTYSNTKFFIMPAPAVEYNFFPYSQSTRRQLRFLYRLGYSYYDYLEETIYNKNRESLLKETLSITLELKERWGTISTTLSGSNYFYDFRKNQLQIYSELSLRLFKGLSLSLWGSYAAIHDQLSLAKGELTDAQIFLRRKELATTYRYYMMIGFSYTFGSVFSNVVNPRFGSGGI
jgi:hypothetical protein